MGHGYGRGFQGGFTVPLLGVGLSWNGGLSGGHYYNYRGAPGMVPIFADQASQVPMQPEPENHASFVVPGGFLQVNMGFGVTRGADDTLMVTYKENGQQRTYPPTNAGGLGIWMAKQGVDPKQIAYVDAKLKLNGALVSAAHGADQPQPAAADSTPMPLPPSAAPAAAVAPAAPAAAPTHAHAAAPAAISAGAAAAAAAQAPVVPGNYGTFTSGSNRFVVDRVGDNQYHARWYNADGYKDAWEGPTDLKGVQTFFKSNRHNIGDKQIHEVDTQLGLNGSLARGAGVPDAPQQAVAGAVSPAGQQAAASSPAADTRSVWQKSQDWSQQHRLPTSLSTNFGGGGG